MTKARHLSKIPWALFALIVAGAEFSAPVRAVGQGQSMPVATQNNYVIGRQDVLNITVYDQPELSGKFTVGPDGTAILPLIGKIEMAGLTLRDLEAQVKKRLADGYLKNPQVTASLDQFRGRRVFIFGAVGSPGMYPLGDFTTIIEALVKAGYNAASEAVVVRVPGAIGPVMPDEAADSEVIRVNLREFEKDVESGELTRNILLQDGDTVFVPRNDRTRVFVSGEVRNPAAYSIPEGTTVLQAVTLAGGFTERASTGRIRISRLIDGKQKTIKAALGDIVQPGDTIIVPERFF